MKKEAILCFIKNGNQILLIQVEYGKDKVFWNGISGFIDTGESFEDAALREVKEEIGIQIDRKSLVQIGNHTVSENLELHVFTATKWNGVPKPMESSIKDVRWFPTTHLPFADMFPASEKWLPEILNNT